MAEADTSMTWTKYPKMKEASSSTRGEYVVTEKIHGANFCIISSPTGPVSFAKRTAVLGTGAECDDFYSVRSSGLVRELDKPARTAATSAGTEIHIYGELFGGHYPHPDVEEVAGIYPVQRGVWYAPGLNFVAFDVKVNGRFMDYDDARQLCEGAGLMFSTPLVRGTLAACNSFHNRFDSTIPARLGLPPLQDPNLAEGVVIRPVQEPPEHRGRGMFKSKISEFSEDRRYQNSDWKSSKRGGNGMGWAPSETDLLRMEVTARVTEQRLANVLSKIGRVDPRDKPACRKLLAAMKEDVCESLTLEDQTVLLDSDTLQEELDLLCRELIVAELRPMLNRSAER